MKLTSRFSSIFSAVGGVVLRLALPMIYAGVAVLVATAFVGNIRNWMLLSGLALVVGGAVAYFAGLRRSADRLPQQEKR